MSTTTGPLLFIEQYKDAGEVTTVTLNLKGLQETGVLFVANQALAPFGLAILVDQPEALRIGVFDGPVSFTDEIVADRSQRFVEFLDMWHSTDEDSTDTKAAMPTIQVDYTQVGHARTFRVPMFSYRKSELQPGTKVLLVGDGVEDQVGVVDCWFPDNQVQISQITVNDGRS